MKHEMESFGTLWTEEDFNNNYTNQEDNLASEASAVVKKQSKTPTKEIWHAWLEPWERRCLKKTIFLLGPS